MEFPPILSTLILFPIISALVLALFRLKNPKWYLYLGTLAAAADFILSLRLFAVHNTTLNTQFQLIEILRFFPNHDIKYFLGIDSLALLLIILTTFLIPICLLLSINSIKTRTKEFVIYFLLMEGLIIGAFCSLDLLLFYIFFEAMLIPMFLIIGIWGSSERIFAAYKFFLYTIFGSVLFLTAIIYIYLNTGTTDIVLLKQLVPHFATKPKIWLWLAMFIAFAIKVPSFPFHTWLPDAHVQAPTAGSVILAGVLIKLGAFAMIRFLLPFFPDTSLYFTNLVFALSIISIIYASLVALMQEDMKKMIAYSSVAHMGFVTMGIFSGTKLGLDGAIFQVLSHGIVSAALFASVGVIYDRLKTKQIVELGGIANKCPNFAWMFMIFMLASVGLPGTSGFVGEFLTIVGTFKTNALVASLAAIGVVLGACYMLWLYKRVFFGNITNPKINAIKDLNPIELISLGLMALPAVALGVMPNLVLNYLR